MDSEWKVHVADVIDCARIDVYVYKEAASSNGIPERHFITNLGTMEVHVVQQGNSIKDVTPTITVDWHCKGILQALVDGLFKHGIRATAEPILKNELTATKYHLEDMRDVLGHVLNGFKVGKKKEGVESEYPNSSIHD